ncbi:MAG: hypothetical protein JSS54_00090 [Proteobacteria bacterium]|nr:hypothetical protein [Pseudomonadota bacterium]
MNIVNHKFCAAAFSLVTLIGYSQATFADGANSLGLKPLQALMIDVGQKRGVGYYTNENGDCRLVLTLTASADAARDDFEATRIEFIIPPSETRQYNSDDGHGFEFGCTQRAEALTVSRLSIFAAAGSR